MEETKESAKIAYRDKRWEVRPGTTIRAAVKKCGLNPETVLATREGRLITDDTQIRPGDEIKLVAVISGG